MEGDLIMSTVTIYNNNCLEQLKQLETESVNLVITSPPYYNLRDYDNENQIGLEDTPEEYLKNLLNVFEEVYRVLKSDGSCWVNIDDVYINQRLMCLPDKFKIGMVNLGFICRNEIICYSGLRVFFC